MDKPHSGHLEHGLLFEFQQQNEFLKRQLACSEAAKERLEEARKEIQEKERALGASEEKYRHIVRWDGLTTTFISFEFMESAMELPGWAVSYSATIQNYSFFHIMERLLEISDGGDTKAVENIACLERGPLRPEDLGLTLAEARNLLESVQHALVEQQVAGMDEQAVFADRADSSYFSHANLIDVAHHRTPFVHSQRHASIDGNRPGAALLQQIGKSQGQCIEPAVREAL